MRHIILEGPDRCGKSTLARRLISDGVVGQVFHHGPPSPGDARREYHSVVLKMFSGPAACVDRFFYGELVYGPSLRRRSQLTWDEVAEFERQLGSIGTVCIFCLPSLDTLRRHLEGVVEPFEWTSKRLETVHADFEECLRTCQLPSYRYDFTDDQDMRKVLRWLAST